jgi:hypothetical protein
MDKIWRRVFYPSLVVVAMGFVAFIGLALWIPTILSKAPMLTGVAALSQNVAPFVLAGFCTWALIDCAPRYFAVRQWLKRKGAFCSYCGGPTIVKWERHKPRDRCLQCGFKGICRGEFRNG